MSTDNRHPRTLSNTTERGTSGSSRLLSASFGSCRFLSSPLGFSRLLSAPLQLSISVNELRRFVPRFLSNPVPAATFHSGWKRDPRLLSTPVSFSRFLSASLGSSRLLPASLGSSGSSQLLPIPLGSSRLLSAPLGSSRLLPASLGSSPAHQQRHRATVLFARDLSRCTRRNCLSDWKQDPRLLGYLSAATIDPSRLSACHNTPVPGFSETGPRTRQEWSRMLMGLFPGRHLQPVHFGVLVMFLRLPAGRALSRQLYD